jgi:hypothetical protein
LVNGTDARTGFINTTIYGVLVTFKAQNMGKMGHFGHAGSPVKPRRNRKKQGKPKYMLDSMGGNAAITPALKVSPPESAEGFTFQHPAGKASLP